MSPRPGLGRQLRDAPGTLGARIAITTVALMVLTGVIAGVAGVALIREANERSARRVLAVLADADQAVVRDAASRQATAPAPTTGPPRTAAPKAARAVFEDLRVRRAVFTRPGLRPREVTGDQVARTALTADELATVVAGGRLSLRVERDAGVFLVEARSIPQGALVLAQRRADGVDLVGSVAPTYLAVLAALTTLAALAGLGLAWWAARPIRALSVAATQLAGGRRDVPLPDRGPREVVDVAADLGALAASLDRADAARREFLMSVSHDLRTPLTTVRGYAEALAEGSVPGPHLRQVGESLVGETARLSRMVEDLLTLARSDAGSLTLHRVPVDAADLLSAMHRAWSPTCERDGIDLRLELDGRAPLPVLVDPERLRQGLDGLMDNAVRLAPGGTPVVLAGRIEGSQVVLEIRDAGPGLTPDDLAVAVERGALAQRYRGRRSGGSGLGLELARQIVSRHDGVLEADHAPEGGACFRVRLPAVEQGAQPA